MNRITLCLKKGLQIGVMGAALATSTVLMAGCSTGSDGNKTEIEQGGNQNDNFFDQYNTPKVKNIGNGFELYQTMGEKGGIGGQGVTAANKFLDKANQHVQNSINNFETSLANRPAAKNYFNSFTNGLKSNSYFHMDETRPGGPHLDRQVNGYAANFNDLLGTIVKNIDKNNRGPFAYAYNFLNNEANNEGSGWVKDQKEYTKERDRLSNTWSNYYAASTGIQLDVNHLPQVTGLMNQYLSQAANKIGQSVTAGDLRQVINMSFLAKSLRSMHDVNKDATLINHTDCQMSFDFGSVITNAAIAANEAEQNNEQTMSY